MATPKFKKKDTNKLSTKELQVAGEVQTREDDTNRNRVLNNWESGQFIDQVCGDKKKYGSGQIERIADHLGIASSTLYGYRRMFKLFPDKSDILALAGGKYSVPYKIVKAFGTVGRDDIMKIYDEADTLREFKIKLRARWEEKKAVKVDDNPDNPPATQKQTDEETKHDKGTAPQDTTTEGNEFYPLETDSDRPQEDEETTDPVKTDENTDQEDTVERPMGEIEGDVKEPTPSEERNVSMKMRHCLS